MTAPTDIWAELVAMTAERTALHAQIDADLDTLPGAPADAADAAIGAHLERCADAYARLVDLGVQIGELIDELAGRGLVEEIGAYLAVTYGGRA